MDLRTYLAIESAITVRLWSAWRPYANDVFQKVASAIGVNDFNGARAIASEVDMTPIGDRNREWIKYHLLTAAYFGARCANPDPRKPLMLSAGSYDATLNRVADLFSMGIEYGATLRVYEQLMKTIADAQHAIKVQKRPSHLQGYTSFKDTGDAALQLQSSLHSSRLAVWGFTAEAETLGVATYQVQAVLDGRTCPFCEFIDGHEFQVSDARASILSALNAGDPLDLKELQPWPDQSKGSLDTLMSMSDGELQASGYAVPPFHPNDRCILTLSGYTPALMGTSGGLTPIGDSLPSSTSTLDTFDEMGENFSADDLDYWNQNVGVSPVDIAARFNGMSPSDYLADNADVENITLLKTGEVVFSAEDVAYADNGLADVSQSYDPVTKTVSVNYVDMHGGSSHDAGRYVVDTIRHSVSAAVALGAVTLAYSVAGGDSVYMSALMGFAPAAAQDWFYIKSNILADIAPGGPLADSFGELTAEQQDAVRSLLGSSDETALIALVGLPYVVHGLPIAEVLLEGRALSMGLDFNDEYARAVYLNEPGDNWDETG